MRNQMRNRWVLTAILLLVSLLLSAWSIGGRAPSHPNAGPHETVIPRPVDPTRSRDLEGDPIRYWETPVPFSTAFPDPWDEGGDLTPGPKRR